MIIIHKLKFGVAIWIRSVRMQWSNYILHTLAKQVKIPAQFVPGLTCKTQEFLQF